MTGAGPAAEADAARGRSRPLQSAASTRLAAVVAAAVAGVESRGTWAYYRLVPDAIERLRDVFAVPAVA